MISFYPGPSALWKEMPTWMEEACDCGILSVNHRSAEFAAMLRNTVEQLRQRLEVPEEYGIFFTSSATETWEIILQSLPIKSSAHYFNGAFGQKWFEYGKLLSPRAEAFPFGLSETPTVHFTSSDLVCITHTETSNGTYLPDTFVRQLREASNGQLIAVDATSSMGGISLPWRHADIWFASVQKCLGLPAGMCVVVFSPAAAARAFTLNKDKHYNAFAAAVEQANNWQTTHTPNVLGIFLVGKAMNSLGNINKVHARLDQRKKDWYDFLIHKGWSLLCTNENLQAPTVMAIGGESKWIERVKSETKKAGFMLGNGYGTWKENSFRIANFPAVQNSDHQRLMELLSHL
ncbi:MAG: aminotransferase class V-fold PLP-dependent enzyme [Cytophagaceae bacterium]|jgi:phosphoserine aminotransferase|nr:aminotransferase class V-fold PLP-dependent enzyme [Cytophagaceae bacterium]